MGREYSRERRQYLHNNNKYNRTQDLYKSQQARVVNSIGWFKYLFVVNGRWYRVSEIDAFLIQRTVQASSFFDLCERDWRLHTIRVDERQCKDCQMHRRGHYLSSIQLLRWSILFALTHQLLHAYYHNFWNKQHFM